ncbi:response regulator [Rhodococcus sp. BP-349]|uniref:response regulator n=1 Tax=unclassified Rhodococcus (in: high G+C Gram-positive bacteria) TaxID=192944 RepID=UPI001C9AFF2B|nr:MULTISPECIES: response regulator [unclassified Rhodococcus (in: high G+C Gram-positive bacteria)]MBY6537177.1 response regulator [Rhodococcus sp. BP-363]MBY6541514.1 response regulator [Rhodococcus sp. BP-369]MBY6560744.1 response regulator [Rhodococcus sp. BP-370]MBY6575036.1 response regulator [Rhodococcus sp. BP-364]MBY6584337.1 response regulator [Rhodococcus sp. BP-358]
MTLRVLVVDDDFMVARVHTGFVTKVDGFEVCGVAHTAQEALEKVESTRPDLVLLDVHLPGVTGLDLIGPFREIIPDLDVLVITSEREAESVRKALRAGAVHYLIKPFKFQALQERLEHYRHTRESLAAIDEAGQDAVDKAFGVRGSATRLPKGLSGETLAMVEHQLRENAVETSASTMAERTGMSRSSARRYLEYLTDIDRVTVSLDYGNVGRPERLYRLKR